MGVILLVSLLDGSQINLRVNEKESVIFRTPYGALTVPWKDVKECTLGVHVSNPEEYQQAAKSLGMRYGQRDAAMKFFRDNRRGAYKYILTLKDDKDAEVRRRVEILLKEYDSLPKIDDALAMGGGWVFGEFRGDKLSGDSMLGKLSIPICNVISIQARAQRNKVTLGAGDNWTEVSYIMDGKVSIRANGDVDLWPAQPGQYTCKPSGFNQSVNGYPAGALIGRIGGKVFLVGESFRSENMDKGRLELRINGVPSGWNSVPSGGYEIVIE